MVDFDHKIKEPRLSMTIFTEKWSCNQLLGPSLCPLERIYFIFIFKIKIEIRSKDKVKVAQGAGKNKEIHVLGLSILRKESNPGHLVITILLKVSVQDSFLRIERPVLQDVYLKSNTNTYF